MRTWPWAVLAMVLAVTLLVATVLDAARTSSVRAALSGYRPHGPPSTRGIVTVLAVALTVIPSVTDALQGDVRGVFRALIFANLFLLWLRRPAVSLHSSATSP